MSSTSPFTEAPFTEGQPEPPRLTLWHALRRWARRVALERKLAVAFSVLAILSGAATAIVITRSGPEGPAPDLVLLCVYLNIAFLLGLGALVVRQLIRIWVERRRGLAGARLHLRLALLFALIAVTPTLIVSVFSAVFFDLGVRGWFSERVSTAVTQSAAVAEAYLEEHRQTIRGDVLAMANDLNREAPFLLSDSRRFEQVITAQAAVRNLTEAVVFDGAGRVYARTGLSFAFDFEPVPESDLERARRGEVVIITSEDDDRMRALVALNQIVDTFLFVGRFVDPALLARVEDTQLAVSQYEALEGRRQDFQLTFAIVFALVALLILLAAIWVGLLLADRLVRPVSSLIDGAERVRHGDLSVRVPLGVGLDEIASLTRAFNRMTAQLESQHEELVDANTQLDERRRFTEAVLGGVSSGVVGLDDDGRINLPNRAASRLLGIDLETRLGSTFAETLPEFDPLIAEVAQRPWREATDQVAMTLENGDHRIFHARVTAEISDGVISGYVLTFDDVTELLSAQRKAAWADVARRIAHEIKNPLTPIQLSAERLRRKYLKEIESDPETFARMIDTIVRQVGDIGRMVDEFSSFARMPTPVMRDEDLRDIVTAATDLQRGARAGVKVTVETGDRPVILRCDSRQIRQALTNLLQNAVDAIEGRQQAEGEGAAPGSILVTIEPRGDAIVTTVADNGRGLPDTERDRLTEPYVTTREKGTGLGLAIVKKIMEDHGGSIELRDRPEGGAAVSLVFSAPPTVLNETNPALAYHGQ
ncbi:PAS domain-containing sensor histidine kinase [Thalassobaculum sp. OXR-137]|uniref:sensor histidine kinase NtrY-like n=1 Tax=Thalassobaculum sp. OXR-137 TaxID=3100173 RepID=UPI002AC93149|nr:PAS domain-containing sensor histidine kinase [Thalassobaculum sp. OXR-137]WPZ33183.1 PAS domain-containing sensor histidine kinase [Thalassobaculum sp. OXR-137]